MFLPIFTLWTFDPKVIDQENFMRTVYISIDEYWSITSGIVFFSCFIVGFLTWFLTRGYYSARNAEKLNIPLQSVSYPQAEETTREIQRFLAQRIDAIHGDFHPIHPETWNPLKPSQLKYVTPETEAYPLLNFVQTVQSLGCEIQIRQKESITSLPLSTSALTSASPS